MWHGFVFRQSWRACWFFWCRRTLEADATWRWTMRSSLRLNGSAPSLICQRKMQTKELVNTAVIYNSSSTIVVVRLQCSAVLYIRFQVRSTCYRYVCAVGMNVILVFVLISPKKLLCWLTCLELVCSTDHSQPVITSCEAYIIFLWSAVHIAV